MSFILDALRKSEAARRRSEAPDLFATMPDAVAPLRARTQWPILAIGAVGVLSLIAALWLSAQRTSSPATVDTATTPAATADTTETFEPASPEVVSTAPEPVPDIAPVEPATAPTIARPISPTAPVQTSPPPAPDVDSAIYDLPAPPESAAPPQTPAPLPADDQIVSLADLDAEARKQLPPLKLSMHLWNETPSRRFVIVDGQRLKEGDVLGEIVLERITRDGAVLVWRGSRLKIGL
jgi:general secretion pathway protein B